MLIVFYSDAGYTRSGFSATIDFVQCPNTCVNGVCNTNNICECQNGWTGLNCATESCPGNCSQALGQGSCDLASNLCICRDGYTGSDCGDIVPDNSWTLIQTAQSEAFQTRFGHSATYDESSDVVWFVHRGCLEFSFSHSTLSRPL
jgi:hypothetical protein